MGAEELPSSSSTAVVDLEVRSMAGELLLRKDFLLSATITDVKKVLFQMHGLARWRQSLIWHEQVLELDSSLASYGISCEDATLQLVMSSPLDEKDMRRIIDLQESCERSVQALTKGSLEELLGLINPPAACELVVRASVRLITCFSPSSL